MKSLKNTMLICTSLVVCFNYVSADPLKCLNTYSSSRKTVRDAYAKLLKAGRNSSREAGKIGIENSETISEIAKISYLTGVDSKTISEQAMEVYNIKSPQGTPDGNEITQNSLLKILEIANTSKVDPKKVFATTVAFLPLIEGKVNDEAALLALVKMSIVYNISPKKIISRLESFDKSATIVKEKISAINQARFDKMDSLSQSLAKLSGFSLDAISPDIVLGIVESSFASGKPMSVAINGLEQLVDHSRATNYTIHEQVSMLKALIVDGQSLDISVSKLVELEKKVHAKWNTSLSAQIEQPAVNLILLAGKTPESIVEIIENIATTGDKYGLQSGALVLNRMLAEAGSSSAKPLIQSAVVNTQEEK